MLGRHAKHTNTVEEATQTPAETAAPAEDAGVGAVETTNTDEAADAAEAAATDEAADAIDEQATAIIDAAEADIADAETDTALAEQATVVIDAVEADDGGADAAEADADAAVAFDEQATMLIDAVKDSDTATQPVPAKPATGRHAQAAPAVPVDSISAAETAVLPTVSAPVAAAAITAAPSAPAHAATTQAASAAHIAAPADETVVMPVTPETVPTTTAPAAPPVPPPGVSASQAMAEAAANLSVIDADSSAFAGFEMKKKRHILRAFLITLGIIIGVLAIAYGVGVSVFSQRFLPSTSFGDMDVSMKTVEEVQGMIQDKVDGYQLDVVGGAFSYRASAEDLDLSVDAAAMAQNLIDCQDEWRWPILLAQGHQEVTSDYALEYDAEKLSKRLRKKVKTYNETATEPTNATVIYDENSDSFIVQPEIAGTQYQPKAVAKAADEAVMSLTPLLTLTPDQLIQPEIKSDDERLKTAAEEATRMVSSHVQLWLDGQDAGSIGPDDLYDLVWFDEDLNVYLDEDALNVWIDGIVKRYDTVGTERYYTRPDGKEIYVSGGEYGWQIDQDSLRQAVLDAVYAGGDTEMEIPCWQTAQVFNGIGNPDWGNRYADVDLSEQYVRFYDWDGTLIWESDCITGVPDGEHNTVEGVWSVNVKESPSKLIGRDRNGKKEYETMVTYWMAFEDNAIGFHDATWQPAFGGNLYQQGYGSHGCVNLPYDKAQELYSLIDWDDVVIVHW